MKQTIILMGLLAVGYANAQAQETKLGRVGINTTTPQAALEISRHPNLPNTQNQGVMFPSFSSSDRDQWTDTKAGTMIYNLSKKCIDYYNGTKWACVGGDPQGVSIGEDSQPKVSVEITLGDSKRFLASVYDNNYMPYTPPMASASWDLNNNPDNTLDPLMNFQGTVDDTGYDVYIPLTATGNAMLEAATFTYIVPANRTQDGNSRTLQLSWETTQVTNSTKHIIAKLKTIDGVLKLKQLDINNGVGKDGMGVELATFNYKGDDKGTMKTLQVRLIAGILDKNVNKVTNDKLEHQMFYLPIKGPDGKTWLSNNLGADYANLNSPFFSPATQAGGASTDANVIKRDYKAYGSLFEYGRDGDGHELVIWTNSITGSLVNSNQNYNDFTKTYIKDNDPCPTGYHTPTKEEYQGIYNIGMSYQMRKEEDLKFPATGFRSYNTSMIQVRDDYSLYWSSTPKDAHNGWSVMLNSGNVYGNYRTLGYPVRCIAD